MAICYPVQVEAYSLYLHIPFCVKRCGYCDFNTFAGMQAYLPDYTAAIVKELELVSSGAGPQISVHTIFFGGGTPSLLSIQQLRSILEVIQARYEVDKDAEISLEANPGTVTKDWLGAARESGINRLSFGVQSSLAHELELLGRIHNQEDVLNSLKWARQAGFNNLNLDMIFGLPNQSLADWQQSIQWALACKPQHLSFYNLIVEEGTPLDEKIRIQELPMPDDDLAADMYEWCMEFLPSQGFEQYEISNWCLPGRECRHNLQYWLGLPYLGFGAGAHGFARAMRTENVCGIPDYIGKAKNARLLPFPQSSWNLKTIETDERTQIEEFMMVGLRLVREGVSRQRFFSRFGIELENVYGSAINSLIEKGLLDWGGETGDTLRLTRRGCLLGNQVFAEFLS
jgi:oxygen-independent coproporphyrinogen-3 oxidase